MRRSHPGFVLFCFAHSLLSFELIINPSSSYFVVVVLKDFMYLFMRDTKRGRDTGRGRSRLHAGSQTQDSIPGPPGSRPGWKADAPPLSPPDTPVAVLFFLLPRASCREQTAGHGQGLRAPSGAR